MYPAIILIAIIIFLLFMLGMCWWGKLTPLPDREEEDRAQALRVRAAFSTFERESKAFRGSVSLRQGEYSLGRTDIILIKSGVKLHITQFSSKDL